jgi:hypothetical protein
MLRERMRGVSNVRGAIEADSWLLFTWPTGHRVAADAPAER